MTGQLLFMAAMGVLLGVCGGYPWGRILRRRDAEVAYEDGYKDGHDDGWDDHGGWQTETRPRPELAAAGTTRALGPGHPDWREQVAAELAPEVLALTNVPEPGPLSPLRSSNDGPGETLDSPGLGHPSPYAGVLTPAQRRRDKHKQRGQYAPAQGWSAPDADMLRETWKPEGAHWLADWQIEWHDHVAQIDEEIAGWVERQRGWLAADRWDRGARRLGAVA